MPSPDKRRYASHDDYFAGQVPAVQDMLQQIQSRVEAQVPGAVRCIGYNMPAFRLGKIFFYFAAFRKHIGIYPPLTETHALIPALAAYRGPKGNLCFPLDQPLPYDLIARLAEALAAQYGGKGSSGRRST